MVTALREMVPAVGGTVTGCPEWFQEMVNKEGIRAWATLLSSAADELEGMQKLSGSLYKTLYPD